MRGSWTLEEGNAGKIGVRCKMLENKSNLKKTGGVRMCQKKRTIVAATVFIVTMLGLTGWYGQLHAQQAYPTKPINVIVPYSPGGSTDLTARVMAEYLKKTWGVPVNVVSKPGGLTVPGCLEVYNAKPDGYTILEDGIGTTSLLLVSAKDLPFKIMDRTYIGAFVASPYAFIVPFNSPVKSMKDLEAEIKKDPPNFTWGSLGGISSIDFCTRKFMKIIGVDIMKTRIVISKGGSESLNLAATGALKLAVMSSATGAAAIDAKLVRPLAVTSSKRLPQFPNVPTIAEAGYPTATFQDYLGPSGPPNLPSSIVEIWEKALEKMQKDPDTLDKLGKLGLLPAYLSARETRELRLKEIEIAKELYGVE